MNRSFNEKIKSWLKNKKRKGKKVTKKVNNEREK